MAKIHYNNILRDAQEGDEGTPYATCAEAVADSDDAHKVRGNIVPADDVSALTALEGAGVVFDATENKYRITDSAALMRKLTKAGLLKAELTPTGSYLDDNILYITFETQPGLIVRFDLINNERIDQLELPSGDDYPKDIIKFGEDFFVACQNGVKGRLVKINGATFQKTSHLDFNTGENYPTSLLQYGNDIFCTCRNTSNEAVIVRTLEGTLRTSALTLDSLELYPEHMVVYGTDIFVVCRRVDNVPMLVRTAGGISRTSVLVIGGDSEVYPIRALVYGTDIFVLCRATDGTGKITKTAGGLSKTSTLTLNAGETFPNDFILVGSDIFVGVGTTSTALVKTAGGTTRTSALSLTGDEEYPKRLAAYSTNIFIISKNSSDIGISTETASGTSYTGATNMSGGELYPEAIVPYGNEYFVACKDASNRGVVVCFSASLQRLSVLVLDSDELHPVDLLVYGSDIFVLCRKTTTSVVMLVRTSGGKSRTSVLELDSTEISPSRMANYGTDIFVVCLWSTDGRTLLVRTDAGLSRTSVLQLNATELGGVDAVVYGTDIFVLCETSANVALLVRCASGLTRTSVLTLNADELNPARLLKQDTDIFVSCSNSSGTGKIVRTAAGLTRTSVLTLDTTEEFPFVMVWIRGYMYVSCRNAAAGNEVKIVKIKDGITKISTLIFDADEQYPSGAMIAHNDYIILSSEDGTFGAGSMHRVDPLSYFTLFERLQDADIGDSFMVRADLFCNDESDDRPMPYAADTHLTPVAKGLENTALSILAHLPNFVEDGGFESGTFDAWAAGGGWSIESSSPLEGAYSARHDLAADTDLTQAITEKIEAGKTIRVVFKAKTVTADGSAGLLTINPKLAGSGTALDSTISDNAPAITTTARWYEFEFTPAYESEDWELYAEIDTAYKGSATALIIDEIYVYRKRTANTLIAARHNWAGQGRISVRPYWCSPLRSTMTTPADETTFTRASIAYDAPGNSHASGVERYEDDRFGNANSAGIIEGGATNIVPSGAEDFDGSGWAGFLGATPTITQNQEDPYGGTTGTRVQTSGGTGTSKYIITLKTPSVNLQYYGSQVWIKCLTDHVIINNNLGSTTRVEPADGWVKIEHIAQGNGSSNLQINFSVDTSGDDVDCLAWHPGCEENAWITSWQNPADGARANESLSFDPMGIINLAEGGISVWAYISDKAQPANVNGNRYLFSLASDYGTTKDVIALRWFGAGGANRWQFWATDNAGDQQVAQTTQAFLSEGWHHFGARWNADANEIALFVDNVKYTQTFIYQPSVLGTVAYVGNWFNGTIPGNMIHDDFQIFNRAPTDAEFSMLYAATDPRTLASFADCTFYLDFDENLDSGSFVAEDSRVIHELLPSSDLPVYEILVPAAAGFTPQIGEIYLGDYWASAFGPEAPFDPLEFGESRLYKFRLQFLALEYAERRAAIKEIFEKLSDNEAVWWQYENDPPIQMSSAQKRYRAAHNPTFVDFMLDLIERL